MAVGIDTGFLFELQAGNVEAVKIWEAEDVVTSAVVLYEICKKAFSRGFPQAHGLAALLREAVEIAEIRESTAESASRIAADTGMPGLDALILASLIEAGCKTVYTTDKHLELLDRPGVTIINLKK